MMGSSGMACFRQLEAWRIGNFSIVRAVRCGRLGWYDTTSGVLSFVAFFAGGLRASSWQRCLARLICCCTVAGKAKQRLVLRIQCLSNVKLLTPAVMVDNLAEKGLLKY